MVKTNNTRLKKNPKLEQTLLKTNADFLYSITSNRLENQLQQIDSHNNKIIRLLGFSGTVLAILIAVISIIGIDNKQNDSSYFYIIVPILSFIFIIITSMISYALKGFQIGPDLKDVWRHTSKHEKSNMLIWASRSFTRAYYHNIRHETKKKELAITLIIWALLIQFISTIFAIIMIYRCT